MTNGNDRAFARSATKDLNLEQDGLTKRELFAGLAMNGLLAGNEFAIGEVPEKAVILADQLIEQLNETS